MRRQIFRSLLVLAVEFLAGGLFAVAQTAPAADGSTADKPLQVTARLVVLDVVVVDRNGHPVTNVDRSKFHIFEDKVPENIRNFDPPNGHEMPAGSTTELVVNSSADLSKIGNAPVNVLVFDEVNTPFLHLAYARQMMEKYLRAQPEVLPVPTLFVAAGATKMAVLHDYTQSRADLLESIKKHTSDLDFTTMLNALNGGLSGADNGMVQSLGALSQIAASVRGVPGRKNIIWVGTGYSKSGDLLNMSDSDRDRVVASIQQVTDRMLAARVTLYTIDPEGVVAAQPINEENIDPTSVGTPGQTIGSPDQKLGFETFAYSTGGRVIKGRNDIDAQVAQVSAEGTEYYTLAYVPTSTNDATRTYRRIQVTVDDPSLRVITRTGYFGGEAPVSAVALAPKAKQLADVKFDLLNAARTTMVYTGLHMTAKPGKNGYMLMVNANDLRFIEQNDGSRLAEVTVVAVCYNAKDRESTQHVAELKEQLQATDVIRPDSQVGFAFPMIVPGFTNRIRFVMRDANTAILGSANVKP
jgi:VWFA-related protein